MPFTRIVALLLLLVLGTVTALETRVRLRAEQYIEEKWHRTQCSIKKVLPVFVLTPVPAVARPAVVGWGLIGRVPAFVLGPVKIILPVPHGDFQLAVSAMNAAVNTALETYAPRCIVRFFHVFKYCHAISTVIARIDLAVLVLRTVCAAKE